MVGRAPGLVPLFTDVRYRLETKAAQDLRKLPLTTITFAGLPSVRPTA
jgi:hypothetical protein